ncbi:hypothetical protein KAR91_17615, partial [Candidatus Pacearchaeota archaeon]|nr:hypothetical protein [Candidatus Pacearchaeota archaeon]
QIYWLPYIPDYYCIIDEAMLHHCLPTLTDHWEYGDPSGPMWVEGWRPKRKMFLRAEAGLEDNYWIYPVVLNGYSRDINGFVVMGGTVTYAMMQLATFMGFSKILLVGVDHYYPKSMTGEAEGFTAEGKDPDHFVCEGGQPYFEPGKSYARPEDTTKSYMAAKMFFDQFNIKCINLTEGTKLDVFEKGVIDAC